MPFRNREGINKLKKSPLDLHLILQIQRGDTLFHTFDKNGLLPIHRVDVTFAVKIHSPVGGKNRTDKTFHGCFCTTSGEKCYIAKNRHSPFGKCREIKFVFTFIFVSPYKAQSGLQLLL